jgi:hypothetical protein
LEKILSAGSLSFCNDCNLKAAAVLSYVDRQFVVDQVLTREFYGSENNKELEY